MGQDEWEERRGGRFLILALLCTIILSVGGLSRNLSPHLRVNVGQQQEIFRSTLGSCSNSVLAETVSFGHSRTVNPSAKDLLSTRLELSCFINLHSWSINGPPGRGATAPQRCKTIVEHLFSLPHMASLG